MSIIRTVAAIQDAVRENTREETVDMCVGIAHIVKGCWPAALTPIVGDEMAEGVRTGHVLACLCIAEHIDAWQRKERLHESCPVCDTIFGPVNR